MCVLNLPPGCGIFALLTGRSKSVLSAISAYVIGYPRLIHIFGGDRNLNETDKHTAE